MGLSGPAAGWRRRATVRSGRRSPAAACGWAAALACGIALLAPARVVTAATSIRIVPPATAVLAEGQRFDIRVEATADTSGAPPKGLHVVVDGIDVTSRNLLDPGIDGERGAGGTGATLASIGAALRADVAPASTTNFLLRDHAFVRAGAHVIEARTADGATARVEVRVEPWRAGAAGSVRARNIIFFLGDGMGVAHRTAARIVSRGITDGKTNGRLAMDTLEYTGQVMTSSLNALVTDSAPGMASYSTGHKASNGQEGVYPDNTADVFDNPRVEYIGAFLKRTRGAGFNVGIVTTADVTDATPGANAVHTADRNASAGIAQRFFTERASNGVTVLMGGGARHFAELVPQYGASGYTHVTTATELRRVLDGGRAPARLLGLFHPSHMTVAFDKLGAGRYSSELAREENAALRDQPTLEEMTDAALRSLAAHSPRGFYLMVEGASIDKQAHTADAERAIWDTIEFDRAVAVALAFADRTNGDADPTNDTLVIVTADHECGGMAILGVGNERYAPARVGRAVRDYLPVRFGTTKDLDLFPNYRVDANGYPGNPDPTRKLLIGWAAAPDRYENWISNRLPLPPAAVVKAGEAPGREMSAANARRDGPQAGGGSDNVTVTGQAIPGFLVTGVIENGEQACQPTESCGDSSSVPQVISGHTATDVVLGATGPGALQFTGVYDNTDVFLKMLRASQGSHPRQVKRQTVQTSTQQTPRVTSSPR